MKTLATLFAIVVFVLMFTFVSSPFAYAQTSSEPSPGGSAGGGGSTSPSQSSYQSSGGSMDIGPVYWSWNSSLNWESSGPTSSVSISLTLRDGRTVENAGSFNLGRYDWTDPEDFYGNIYLGGRVLDGLASATPAQSSSSFEIDGRSCWWNSSVYQQDDGSIGVSDYVGLQPAIVDYVNFAGYKEWSSPIWGWNEETQSWAKTGSERHWSASVYFSGQWIETPPLPPFESQPEGMMLELAPTQTPEPATMSLLVVGGLTLLARRRRQRQTR